MQPKGASTGAKRKVVKTVRTVRKTLPSKAAAAPAEEIASSETPAVETASRGAAASETASAHATISTGLSLRETTPLAASVEAAPTEPPTKAAPDASAAAKEVAEVVDVAPETAAPEPAEAPEGAAGMAEAAAKPPGKKVITRVRKVIRRVPVKRARSAAAMEKEEKGGDGEERHETVAMVVKEQEGSPNNGEKGQETEPTATTERVGITSSGKEKQETEPVTTEEQERNPSTGQEPEPMVTTEQDGNPSRAEAAVSASDKQIEPASNSDQPSAPDNTTTNVEAAVSAAAAPADGPSPVVMSRKIIRKVKKRVPVKRMVKKAEASQKEEKMEEAEVGRVSEKLSSQDSDVNAGESSNAKDLHVQVDASAASNGAPQMLTKEDAIPASGHCFAENGGMRESVEADQDKREEAATSSGSPGDVLPGETERQKRRKTEIFIGGLDRDAKEDDIRKVFGRVGEIVEIRLMMDGNTGKNKGYAFLRYANAEQAKQAVKEFTKVEICGKQCGAAALEGNDTIFLGNIDKNWKKDDVVNLLNEIGIEKIDTLTIMPDPKNADCNRGFAFLELETNRDAQIAFKKLQKKDVFGKGRNINVAWAEPLNDPDEEEMQKVKSVYAEGIPSSWEEKKVREFFKKFGQIERVVLSRNMQSAKRKDFAFVNFTTREAALSCIESFDKEELTDKGSKVNLKVSLAKPVRKGKQNKARSKAGSKDSSNEKPKGVQRETKVVASLNKTQSFKGPHGAVKRDNTSKTRDHLHVLREQASWKQGQPGYPTGTGSPGYGLVSHGGKRPLSALGDDVHYSDPRGYPRVRLDSAYPVANTSYSSSQNMSSASLQHYHQQNVRYGTGSIYVVADASRAFQMRQGNTPHGSGLHPT